MSTPAARLHAPLLSNPLPLPRPHSPPAAALRPAPAGNEYARQVHEYVTKISNALLGDTSDAAVTFLRKLLALAGYAQTTKYIWAVSAPPLAKAGARNKVQKPHETERCYYSAAQEYGPGACAERVKCWHDGGRPFSAHQAPNCALPHLDVRTGCLLIDHAMVKSCVQFQQLTVANGDEKLKILPTSMEMMGSGTELHLRCAMLEHQVGCNVPPDASREEKSAQLQPHLYEVSHLCHCAACARRWHLVLELHARNLRRMRCSTLGYCCCGLFPHCFPWVPRGCLPWW